MAPLWLVGLFVFAQRTASNDTDGEKALGDQNFHRSGQVYGRYDTDVDGEPIVQRSWCVSLCSVLCALAVLLSDPLFLSQAI